MLVGDPRGSVWRRWDFHVHTLSSVGDYGFPTATNVGFVEQIERSGVSAIAITDHHTIDVERVLELQQLAAEELAVFPRIEFRAPIGKLPFHYTRLFPAHNDLEDLWEHLSVEAVSLVTNPGTKQRLRT